MAKMNVVVRPGHTVQVGEAKTTKNDAGRDVPTTPEIKSFGPGKEVSLDKDEAERLIEVGSVVRKGTEEAAAAQRIADTIPENFPGKDELAKAGIENISAVPRSKEELTALEGIGAKTADAILKALPEEK